MTQDRAAKCLIKDRAGLRAFHDFPAGNWKHIRTTNPIESTFASVRHRTTKTKGCLGRQMAPSPLGECSNHLQECMTQS